MMKHILRLLPLWVLILGMTSCVSTKKIVYFQGSDELYAEAQKVLQQYEMRVKPADNLLVKITCDQPELLTIFAQDVTVGSAGTTSMSSQGGTVNNVYGYTVNTKGCLTLPMLGEVPVDGCTVDECAERIEKRIKELNLIANPEVTVRLMNARVAVLGAVRTPGVVSLQSERNSILDVIASVGDVSDAGLRQNVKLFREVEGQRMMYTLDLTKADVFSSPAFYVQQNDMIYVEPNKSASIKSSAFYTFLTAGGSILGVISAIISMIVLIDRN